MGGRSTWRSIFAATWLVFAFCSFAALTSAYYPADHWLFTFVLRSWVWCLFALGGAFCAGLRLSRVLLPVPARVSERGTFALGVGVLCFVWGVFVVGLAGFLNRTFFFAWPTLLLAFGGRYTFRAARRHVRHLRRFGVRLVAPRSAVELVAAAALLLCLVALYAHVLTPGNLGADAQGYHLPIAEHYVAAGKIRPFAEGWYAGAYPQLSSLLYTWGFLAPGTLRDREALCSHLEWCLFLTTVLSMAPLVRRLIGRRTPFAGAALFLFPGIFLYDSNLITTADHILAYWTVPLALALLRLARTREPRDATLVGLFTAAAALTKVQGIYPFVVTLIIVVALSAQSRRLALVAAWAFTFVVASSAHWAKNLAFYGDPLYPLLHRYFPSHPLHARAIEYSARLFRPDGYLPTGNAGRQLRDLLTELVTFSFEQHPGRWAPPLFGSLFTLTTPLLFVLPSRKCLRACVASLYGCLAVWWMTVHMDRFLQILLPCFAACTLALLNLAWHAGLAVRLASVALVVLQAVWGSDVCFIRRHATLGDNPLKAFVDYVALGEEGRFAERERPIGPLSGLQGVLPVGSKLLIHDLLYGQLGAGTQIVNDALGHQGAVFYPELDTPASVAAMWQKLGVTHASWVVDGPVEDLPVLAGEMVFERAVSEYGNRLRAAGSRDVYRLRSSPSHPDLAKEPTRIAWYGCLPWLGNGLYTPLGWIARVPTRGLSAASADADALRPANVLALQSGCKVKLPSPPRGFERRGRKGDITFFVRTARKG